MGIFNRNKPNKEEEQMLRHQSAPRPTAQGKAQRLYEMQRQKMMQGQGMNDMGAMDGFKALSQVIGKEQVQKANHTLQKYKEGKANLEQKIVDNEQWYKMRPKECSRQQR